MGRGNATTTTRYTGALLLLLAVLAWLVPATPAYAQQRRPPRRPPTPVQKRQVIRAATLNKVRYLYLRDIANFYRCSYVINVKSDTATLVCSDGSKVVFTVNKIPVQLGDVRVALSYPLLRHRGEMMLSQSDFTELIDPIMRPARIPKRWIKTVMLDPGHGGKDNGAKGGNVLEKTQNLIIAKRVGAILKRRGYKVLYTRNTDVTMELPARSTAAARQKPDLFLSIHCNWISDPKISGIEVFVANPANVPSYGTKTLGKDAPATKFNTVNALWAWYTQRALINATNAEDRGVKRKQFYVIRETPVPSMLVECGFLSNEAERKNLIDQKYLDKLAVALCDGVDALAKSLRPLPVPRPLPPPQSNAAPGKK